MPFVPSEFGFYYICADSSIICNVASLLPKQKKFSVTVNILNVDHVFFCLFHLFNILRSYIYLQDGIGSERFRLAQSETVSSSISAISSIILYTTHYKLSIECVTFQSYSNAIPLVSSGDPSMVFFVFKHVSDPYFKFNP